METVKPEACRKWLRMKKGDTLFGSSDPPLRPGFDQRQGLAECITITRGEKQSRQPEGNRQAERARKQDDESRVHLHEVRPARSILSPEVAMVDTNGYPFDRTPAGCRPGTPFRRADSSLTSDNI